MDVEPASDEEDDGEENVQDEEGFVGKETEDVDGFEKEESACGCCERSVVEVWF